jgi:hypothetical protein
MRIIRLSDHPGEMLQAAALQRRTGDQQAVARYEQALAHHRAGVAAARAVRDNARAERRWLAWLRGAFAVWSRQHRAPRQPVFAHATTDQEDILAAGMAGEQLVATELGRALGNEWVLLGGYRNRGGEIDHLLLGPRGLFAIEVKHRNATVYIDGDDWRFDKYDRFGNLVEQGRITDRGGRSPSKQVNDPADDLQRFLKRSGQQIAIKRVVVLTHPRSELGRCRNSTVSVATSTGSVLDLVNKSPSTMRPPQLAKLQQLIEQDHQFHLAPGGSASSGSRPVRRAGVPVAGSSRGGIRPRSRGRGTSRRRAR